METGIGLGSNLGDRLDCLVQARDRLAGHPDVRVLAQSPVYETEPVGVAPEYSRLRFLNAVLIIETSLAPRDLVRFTHEIETALGRRRLADRYAPRPIDLDILYMGRLETADSELTLPHPQCRSRCFVLAPLADVRPDLRLPGDDLTIAQHLAARNDSQAVLLYSRDW